MLAGADVARGEADDLVVAPHRLPRLDVAHSDLVPGRHTRCDGNVRFLHEGGPGRKLDTGLRKFGALLGDGCDIGCNAVLNPGSIIGRGAVIYPGVNWRGILPANMIAKNKAAIEVVIKRAREA